MNALLTLLEAARLLKVSTRTLQRLLARHQIEAHQVGSQWRFTEGGIEAYLMKTRRPMVKVWKAGEGRMIVRIYFKGKPAGVTLSSEQSAREYIDRHPERMRPLLTWKVVQR